MQFDGLADGVLVLRAQNEFVLEWVKANFLAMLTGKLAELAGAAVTVAWTVDDTLVAPIAGLPKAPPARPRPSIPRPPSK